MSSAWLDTPLEIYEAHVGLEQVGQAAAIRNTIAAAVRDFSPASLLYLGCAGGNGLEDVPHGTRIIGVDFQQSYLAVAEQRWRDHPAVWVHHDLNQPLPEWIEADLGFAALVLEYLDDVETLLRNLRVKRLVAMILETREGAPAVTDSPYREALLPVGREFRYLSRDRFVEVAGLAGFVLEQESETPLPGGKFFSSLTLARRLR